MSFDHSKTEKRDRGTAAKEKWRETVTKKRE